MKIATVVPVVILAALVGCSTIYYGAMEKVGIHKRDIMVDRIKDARDSQNDAKKQFQSALEQFQSVVNYQGGDLEKEYNRLNKTLQKTEAGAERVHDRIDAVEDVSKALFKEWRQEIEQYASDSLRKASQRKYDLTQKKYAELITAMKKAESRLEPALQPLRDQVLFMKHNLNARAIAGLSDEVVGIQSNVDQLVSEMEKAVDQADAFIRTMAEE